VNIISSNGWLLRVAKGALAIVLLVKDHNFDLSTNSRGTTPPLYWKGPIARSESHFDFIASLSPRENDRNRVGPDFLSF
jgi:hypothetical protein